MNSIDDVLSAIDARDIPRPYLSGAYAVTDEQILAAEENLGFSLPKSYREFLRKVGSGDFRGVEFYGLIPSRNEIEETPNALWITRSAQNEIGLPSGLFVVEDLGDGVLACLDLTELETDECPVILWDPSEKSVQKKKVLAESFGDYLMSRILTVLE